MVSRDYTKEVGLESADKRVPNWLAALVIIALIAIGVYAVKTWGLKGNRHLGIAHEAPAAVTPS